MQPGETVEPNNQPSDGQTGRTELPPVENPSHYLATNSQTGSAPVAPAAQASGPEITWTASEYIAHEKSLGWFMGLAAVSVLVATAGYLVTKDMMTIVVVLVVTSMLGVFALRKPRVLSYRLDHSGITIADRHYPYAAFGSFAVRPEEAIDSILLTPLKRFRPELSIYFPPEQGDQIISTLGAYLPHEERPPDAIDRLMRKLRF